MLLSIQEMPHTTFGRTSTPPGDRNRVEDVATATGAVGAGGAARLGYFNKAGKVSSAIDKTTQAAKAVVEPVKQSKSLWNALKLNYQNFKTGIANWANASKMPNFMKALFTGKLGKAIGGVAAVFVFLSGTGEVINTLSKTLGGIASPDANINA